ncbi:DUF362 domain-containing protein [Desulfovermiculus halophilus]|jgi:uncharacterized protein (DUF362 family)/ferredoxin|uniref:DUF362 domain-containing protein n=1 Tax=Desulfovermiculus halophilus TaxID=339722 RepID=UPI0004879685|nr:DUF362 domain-containing protein [Desulfovermiculus halophilus]
MSRVLIEPADYTTCLPAVRKALELFPQDMAGKKVLIKPNVLRIAKPEEGVVTHPALLQAVVRAVEDYKPASIVVGDNPGLFNYGDNERCFEQSGLMEAAQGYYQNIGTDSVQMDFDPELLPRVGVSKAVLDADVVISLPKFKTHGLTVITGAIKNSYGILPGGLKAKLHKASKTPERFQETIVDVFRLRVPDLFIMDAVVGMEGNGPASPDLRDIGRILAADNAVAMDAVMASMMGLDPGRLRSLHKARDLGLGDFDPQGIEIIGDLVRIPDFKLPPLGGEDHMANADIQEMMRSKAGLKPRADPELCTGCGECIEHCPVSALEMGEDNIPEVDADTCITCFCCQELCPEKAMSLQ